MPSSVAASDLVGNPEDRFSHDATPVIEMPNLAKLHVHNERIWFVQLHEEAIAPRKDYPFIHSCTFKCGPWASALPELNEMI